MTVKDIVDEERKVRTKNEDREREYSKKRDQMDEVVTALRNNGCRLHPIRKLPMACTLNLNSDKWVLHYRWVHRDSLTGPVSWLHRKVDIVSIVYNVVLDYRVKIWNCYEIGPTTIALHEGGDSRCIDSTAQIAQILVNRYLDK